MGRLVPSRELRPVVAALAVIATVIAALTVYNGSGGRGRARCVDAFFVGDGSWSWTHFATRCEYGLPTRAGYVHSWSFYLLVAVILGLGYAWLYGLLEARRQRSST